MYTLKRGIKSVLSQNKMNFFKILSEKNITLSSRGQSTNLKIALRKKKGKIKPEDAG